MTVAEFHLFNRLPIDIRNLIWSCSLTTERRIQVISYTSFSSTSATATYPTPSILFVCRESRDEALRSLSRLVLPSPQALCPSTSSSFPISNTLSPQPLYENPQVCYFNRFIDTVYLSCNPLFRSLLQSWLANDVVSAKYLNDFTKIQFLSIDRRWVPPLPGSINNYIWDDYSEASPYVPIETIVRYMKKVTILHIISHDGYWQSFGSFSHGTGHIQREPHLFERDSSNSIPKYEWVTAEEIARRAEPVHRPRIWAEWGPMTMTAGEITEVLNTDGEHAMRIREDMQRRLTEERAYYPDGWIVPVVSLDFVTPTNIWKIQNRKVSAGDRLESATLSQRQLTDDGGNYMAGIWGLWSKIRRLVNL